MRLRLHPVCLHGICGDNFLFIKNGLQESIRSGSLYYLTNAICDTTHDILKLLHVLAPRCHLRGVFMAELYKLTYQCTPCTPLL